MSKLLPFKIALLTIPIIVIVVIIFGQSYLPFKLNFSVDSIFEQFTSLIAKQTLQNPSATSTPNTLINKGPVTSEPVSLTLNLSNPEDNSLVFEAELLVSGKTSPAATVILSSDLDDQVVEISPRGDFSLTLKLQKGVNKFIVSAFDTQGNSKSESRTIYYSTEKI